jgi:hypothetical protein
MWSQGASRTPHRNARVRYRMTFETRVMSAGELARIERQVPVQLWNSTLAAALYGSVITLACMRASGDVAGLWVCPVDDGRAARRACRLLPYASPWIDPSLHAATRHRVAGSLLDCLRGVVAMVDLPMDPWFRETAGFLAHDAHAVFRHTRVLDIGSRADRRAGYLPATRNHVRAARAHVTVTRTGEHEFAFDRAIKGQDAAAVSSRTAAGMSLGASSWPTFCLTATDREGAQRGQVFVVRNQDSAILLHSWFDRSGPRGVPSLLVDQAADWAGQEWKVPVFDFEGSVIPSIDQFMAGLGAEAVGYAQLRWEAADTDGPARTVLQ